MDVAPISTISSPGAASQRKMPPWAFQLFPTSTAVAIVGCVVAYVALRKAALAAPALGRVFPTVSAVRAPVPTAVSRDTRVRIGVVLLASPPHPSSRILAIRLAIVSSTQFATPAVGV